jgi:membrane-bound lytic murein transglycosylase D
MKYIKTLLRFALLFLLLSLSGYALSITQKYPSYTYVFDEFDVKKSYIHNPEFVNFISKNERNLKAFYRRSLKRGQKILPTMKGLLVGEGVSDLFLYLSMIESGFSQGATSPKKAVGLWQFIPATARQYNLKVCNEYDERCDTVSATSAAINYLNKLHRQFGKWYLAAMAYNCGEGCVERAIRKAGTDDIETLTDNRLKILPKETRDYIRKILLVAMIGESKKGKRVGSKSSNKLPRYSSDELIKVEVLAGTSLKKLAKLIKMDYKVLQKLNRRMKNGLVPMFKKKYMITIPLEKIYAFYLRYEVIEENRTEKTHLISYTVSIGDTIESIAHRYNAQMADIMQANQLVDEFLEVDQLLVIPVTKKMFEKSIRTYNR